MSKRRRLGQHIGIEPLGLAHLLPRAMWALPQMWRLDFTKRNHIPSDFVPHGAAAVVRALDGRLRFPVWDGQQFHGDVGERLGLKARYSTSEFTILCAVPGAEVHTPANLEYKTWCLGDYCPPQYNFPPDWDVLGQIAPTTSTHTTCKSRSNRPDRERFTSYDHHITS